MAKPGKQIVVAWADETALEPTGRMVMRDLNWFPEYRTAFAGHAAMWLRRGTETDIAKATVYAERLGHTVFVYDTTVKNPLDLARVAVTTAKAEGRT